MTNTPNTPAADTPPDPGTAPPLQTGGVVTPEDEVDDLDEVEETILVRERIVRRGQLLHNPGEELDAEYAKAIGVNSDGTDAGEANATHYPGDVPDTSGSSWEAGANATASPSPEGETPPPPGSSPNEPPASSAPGTPPPASDRPPAEGDTGADQTGSTPSEGADGSGSGTGSTPAEG